MFTAVLFTIAKKWKQPKYPLTDGWMDKDNVVHIHNGINIQPLKKKKMPFAATWMDPEMTILK